jgi:hypothetical protein
MLTAVFASAMMAPPFILDSTAPFATWLAINSENDTHIVELSPYKAPPDKYPPLFMLLPSLGPFR